MVIGKGRTRKTTRVKKSVLTHPGVITKKHGSVTKRFKQIRDGCYKTVCASCGDTLHMAWDGIQFENFCTPCINEMVNKKVRDIDDGA